MNRATPASNDGWLTSIERFVWEDRDGRTHWHDLGLRVLRLFWAVGRDLTAGQLTLQAMSLVYTTLLSLVPLLAISFSILKGFGVHNQIEPFLLNALEPLGERRMEVVGRIIGFVDNVQVGVLGSVGFVLLFYTVVSLMQKIEHAFNEVWQVGSKRTLAERFKDYLSVIVIGPVLIFASLGIMATVMSDPLMERLLRIQPVGALVELAGRLMPIAMVTLAFTFVYTFVPHTRVRLRPALTGGLVAGVLWNAVGWMFAAFVARANQYTAIYSGFATPILFMIWLYVSWLILLVGASIAFYRQHPEYLSGRQLTSNLSSAERERLALHALCLVGERFYRHRPAPDVETLSQHLQVPSGAVEQVLYPLERHGVLATTDSDPPAYLPGCPWESYSVSNLLEVIHQSRRGDGNKHPPALPHPAVDGVLAKRRELTERALGELTLKTLVTEGA